MQVNGRFRNSYCIDIVFSRVMRVPLLFVTQPQTQNASQILNKHKYIQDVDSMQIKNMLLHFND